MPTNIKYYQEKGYIFTKYRDKFEVKVEDLSPCSHKKVEVICDYCGEIYVTPFIAYLNSISKGKCACKKCASKKVQDILQETKGVISVFQLEEIKEKSKQTCKKKYGVSNVAQSEVIKRKIAQTNLERYGNICTLNAPEVKEKAERTCEKNYGVKNSFASKEIQERIKNINIEKYGVENIAHAPIIAEKIKQTNLEKYGVPYSTQAESVIRKMRKSFYKNGSVPSSKEEKQVCEILKQIYGENTCIPNYPCGRLNLDCLLIIDGIKIDVEYDGWYWHKNKQEYDKRRNYWLISQGFRIIRILSNKEVPSKEQIIEAVNKIKQGEHLVKIILDIDI